MVDFCFCEQKNIHRIQMQIHGHSVHQHQLIRNISFFEFHRTRKTNITEFSWIDRSNVDITTLQIKTSYTQKFPRNLYTYNDSI